MIDYTENNISLLRADFTAWEAGYSAFNLARACIYAGGKTLTINLSQYYGAGTVADFETLMLSMRGGNAPNLRAGVTGRCTIRTADGAVSADIQIGNGGAAVVIRQPGMADRTLVLNGGASPERPNMDPTLAAEFGPDGAPTKLLLVDEGGTATLDLDQIPLDQRAIIIKAMKASKSAIESSSNDKSSLKSAPEIYFKKGAPETSISVFLPGGVRRSGEDRFVDSHGREVTLTFGKGGYVSGVTAVDGGVTVRKQYDQSGDLIASDIRLNSNPLPIQWSDAGGVLGDQLGRLLADGNQLVGTVASATLRTLGTALGNVAEGLLGGVSIQRALHDSFATIGSDLFEGLKSQGIGAVSSYLTAELAKALNIDGLVGDLFNTAGGSVVSTILGNIADGAGNASELLSGAGSAATLGTAAGSFIGNRLAREIVSPRTLEGQIGSAIGSSLGVIAGTSMVLGAGAKATLLGVQLGIFAGPAGALAGAFLGTIAGALIGDAIAGTPRSGADVRWDAAKREFVVANAYSKKGGSKDAATAMASMVAETFNGVIAATGGSLVAPEAVRAGNYGMRNENFVYRPVSTREKEAITQRFKGDDGPAKLIAYGIFEGLTDPDFKIAGGDFMQSARCITA